MISPTRQVILRSTKAAPQVTSTLELETVKTETTEHRTTFQGIAIAFIIFGLWASDLIFLFSLDLTVIHKLWIIPAIFCQAFLFTGLFVTAHDAMHRSLLPEYPKINDAIGSIAVFLYAFFSYSDLYKRHSLHHRHPASELDPDFHPNSSQKPWLWYLSFMRKYWGWTQLIGFTIAFYGIKFIFGIHNANLILFWIVPLVVSSIQLFYFGTFLTHREPKEGYLHPHRAKSSAFPVFLSFITCYHFGYHEEHHDYPFVAWWQLPTIRKQQLTSAKT